MLYLKDIEKILNKFGSNEYNFRNVRTNVSKCQLKTNFTFVLFDGEDGNYETSYSLEFEDYGYCSVECCNLSQLKEYIKSIHDKFDERAFNKIQTNAVKVSFCDSSLTVGDNGDDRTVFIKTKED